MTIPQFISYLDQQPWKLEYIQNLLTADSDDDMLIENYISGTFSWTDTPQGHAFWSTLRNSTDLTADKDLTIPDLILAIHTHYLPTNPELLL